MAIEYHGHLTALQDAFRLGRLTFYLGAGVAKPNGLPKACCEFEPEGAKNDS